MRIILLSAMAGNDGACMAGDGVDCSEDCGVRMIERGLARMAEPTDKPATVHDWRPAKADKPTKSSTPAAPVVDVSAESSPASPEISLEAPLGLELSDVEASGFPVEILAELGLDPKLVDALKSNGLESIEDVRKVPDLEKLKRIGPASVPKIKAALAQFDASTL